MLRVSGDELLDSSTLERLCGPPIASNAAAGGSSSFATTSQSAGFFDRRLHPPLRLAAARDLTRPFSGARRPGAAGRVASAGTPSTDRGVPSSQRAPRRAEPSRSGQAAVVEVRRRGSELHEATLRLVPLEDIREHWPNRSWSSRTDHDGASLCRRVARLREGRGCVLRIALLPASSGASICTSRTRRPSRDGSCHHLRRCP